MRAPDVRQREEFDRLLAGWVTNRAKYRSLRAETGRLRNRPLGRTNLDTLLSCQHLLPATFSYLSRALCGLKS